MTYTPPYTITSKMVTLIAQITEAVTRIEILQPSAITPMLRRKNRIKTLAGTLEIEGNMLGEEKITALLDGKRVLGTVLELAEVQGAIKAYEKLEEYRYDAMNDLLSAHKILMGDILKTAGTFRTVNVGVGGESGMSHVAPPYDRVSELMGHLFEWLGTSDAHPLIISSVFHYEFEFIHPFSDGNGRIGRLWQSVILHHWKKVFASIPVESAVRERQQDYYHALESSGSMGESTPFIEFMLEAILESIAKVGERVGERVGENLTGNQKQIIAAIQANPNISAQELSIVIGISSRKIEANIAKLKQKNLLKRIGAAKGGHWEVLS